MSTRRLMNLFKRQLALRGAGKMSRSALYSLRSEKLFSEKQISEMARFGQDLVRTGTR